jgi:DedD protein
LGRRWRGFGYNAGDRAASAALGFRGFAPIVDTLVKERLTGALILVGLIVVLVPELLSGPIARTVNTHGPVSPAEEPPLRSYTINLADEPRGGSGSARPQPSAPAAPVTAAPEPAAATTPPPTAAATETEPAPPVTRPAAANAPPAAPPSAATPAGSGAAAYVVQLGSFANRANAERLAQQVHALGYPVGVSRGTTGRRLYRVQVGPTHDRAAAEQTAERLRAQGHKGAVVPK